MGEHARYLRTQSSRYGHRLERIPAADWPPMPPMHALAVEVWRSNRFLLCVWLQDGYERLSILRTDLADERSMRYKQGISWDDLQRLKAECGRGDRWAVEVFPPEGDVVNVQNMRHLFVLKEAPPYGWRKEEAP